MKVLLVGPFGGKNLGDDLILSEFCKFIALFPSLSVVHTSYQHTSIVNGIESIPVLNIRRLNIQCLFAIRHFDAVIFCGGQQIQEPRIKNPIWGHLANMFWISVFSKAFGKKLHLLCVGCQYPLSFLGIAMFRAISTIAESIIMRDHDSLSYLASLSASSSKPRLQLSTDLVLSSYLSTRPITDFILSYSRRSISTVCLFISSQSFSLGKKLLFDNLCKLLDHYNHESLSITVSFTDTQNGYDSLYALDVFKFLSSFPSYTVQLLRISSLLEFTNLASTSDLVVSTRLHPTIFALINKIPFYSLNPEPKTISFLRSLSLDAAIFITNNKSFKPLTELSVSYSSIDHVDLKRFISNL